MIVPIKIKIRPTGDIFLIHNTKGDIRKLSDAINIIIEKQNEVIDVLNILNEVVKKLKWS